MNNLEKSDVQFVVNKTQQYELFSIKRIWFILLFCFSAYYFIRYFLILAFLHNTNVEFFFLFQEIQNIPLSILNIFSLYYIILKVLSMRSLLYQETKYLTKNIITKIIFLILLLVLIPQLLLFFLYLFSFLYPKIELSQYLINIVVFPTMNLSVLLLFNFFILNEFYVYGQIKEFIQSSLLLFLYPIVQVFILIFSPSIFNHESTSLFQTIFDPLEILLAFILFFLAIYFYVKSKTMFESIE